MDNPTLRSAPARKPEIPAEAAALGIDEAYISTLVESFYGRIREDEMLGPVFAGRIADWAPHLEKMKAFWSSVALNTGRYDGRPVPAHITLPDLTPDHFAHWLSLFRQTLEETAPTPDAVPYFMERAERIAESLQLVIFGVPELQIPGRPGR